MSKIKKGRIVRGTVSGVESYGVFVSCDDYYTGLIHISEISHGFVKNIEYKKNIAIKRKKIKETSLGFKTLEYKLPIWIEESLKKIKNH